MQTTPIEKIICILQEGGGYRQLSTPLKLSSLQFDIPAAMIGIDKNSDLIIIADTLVDKDIRIQQKVEGIARALDILNSRRSLTTILAGPRPRNEILEAISRVSRTLPVGDYNESGNDENLKNWLSVLLPLNIGHTDYGVVAPLEHFFRDNLSSDEEPFLKGISHGSLIDANAVEEELVLFLTEALNEVNKDD